MVPPGASPNLPRPNGWAPMRSEEAAECAVPLDESNKGNAVCHPLACPWKKIPSRKRADCDKRRP